MAGLALAAQLALASHSCTGGLFPTVRHFPEPNARAAVLADLCHLLQGLAPPERRTVAPAGLLHGSGIGRHVVPHRADRVAMRHYGMLDTLGRAIAWILAVRTAHRSSARRS